MLIASLKHLRLGIAVAGIIAVIGAIITSTFISLGQEPARAPDPSTEPLPEIVVPEFAQSIVAIVEFNGPTDASFVEGAVSLSPPPARVGGPPLINIQALDGGGTVLETYDEWHPLWAEIHGGEDDGGGEQHHSLLIQDREEGRFIIDFNPNVKTIVVTDIELGQTLIEINAQKIIVPYCVANEDDPGCESVEMEGCGPGYWSSNADPWTATEYSRADTVDSVFSNASPIEGATLVEALNFGGGRGIDGAKRTLLSAAVAALLNSAHPQVAYALTEADLIQRVDDALASNDRRTMLRLNTLLNEYNNAGCPVDAHGELIGA